jgi:MFS family permease
VVTAVATWMPTLYERQFHLTQGKANSAFGALAILGGIPGTLIGGRIADRYVQRVLGARVFIPGICLLAAGSFFLASFIPMPFASMFVLQLVGFFIFASAVPALQAGLADATPSSVRGTGAGAFNVASIIFGSAVAPLVTAAIANHFGGNYRVAFAIVMPISFVGSFFLLAARRHIEADTAKIFEAVIAAQARADEGSEPA